MFSKACKYGIKAVLYIAAQSMNGSRVKVGDIVDNAGVPEAFTGKILGALARNEIVDSFTGPYGGFEIDVAKMKKVKIGDIVSAIDGDDIYSACVLGFSECTSDNPCAMHHKIFGIKEQLKQVLKTTSVYELALDVKAGRSLLTSLKTENESKIKL